MRLFPLLVLLLPLIEIAGFAWVGGMIGVLPTLCLVLASTIAGVLLLRIQGFAVLRPAQAEMAKDGDPGRQLAHGAMIAVAAVLFIVPGFFTDLVGLLLLLPPVRDFAWRRLKGNIVVTGFKGFGGSARRGRTIDLDEDDYSRERPPSSGKGGPSPWKQIDHE